MSEPVRIARVRLRVLSLPLRNSFRTGSHAKDSIRHILVELEDADGVTGTGEVASEAAPYYGPETAETCWEVLSRHFVPVALATDWTHPRDLWDQLSRFRGNHFAKAGLDMAAWDLYARRLGLSLATALGAQRDRVPAGISIGVNSDPAGFARTLEAAAGRGYRRIKLKIGPGIAHSVARQARRIVPPGWPELGADGNATFHRDDLPELLGLDDFQLCMLEQPFGADDLTAHQQLAATASTPVCLDESLTTPRLAELAISMSACRQINIKISRTGGLTPALAMHDVAVSAGVPAWCGGMHEFGVGRAANIALAALPGFSLTGDISAPAERYDHDIIAEPFVVRDGYLAVPAGPGIGVTVDTAFVSSRAEREAEYTATGTVKTTRAAGNSSR